MSVSISKKQVLEYLLKNDSFIKNNLEKTGLLTSEGLQESQVDRLADYLCQYYGAHWRAAIRGLFMEGKE